MSSNQEVADTRIILHSAHAAEEGYRAVVVTAEDTDVMLRCLAFSPDMPLVPEMRNKESG